MLAELLLPDQNVLSLKEVVQENDVLVVTAETKTKEANCPDCGQCSLRVHGRYHRQIADLPCTCYSLLIDLEVRRFKCTNDKCIRRTFTERLPDVVRHYGRRTERLRDNQHHVALHAGGELGHRLIKPLNLTTSADTLLRLVRDGEEQEIHPPRVVGIDDWAFRKGQSYGTIIIDLERQKPIDLLPDRTAGTVSEWLKQYPSIEIISRDRATEYAKAATEGAPQAIQVADRWHLLKNLRDATERFLGRHSRYLKATIPIIENPPENEDDEVEMVPLAPAEQDSLKRRERRLALFEKVRKMHQEGGQSVKLRGNWK
ncbi:MAG: ISL3 family transposase [Anaerolineales bacterium]|nr:ISL3 family transposase [Anaerolineales bacterium]